MFTFWHGAIMVPLPWLVAKMLYQIILGMVELRDIKANCTHNANSNNSLWRRSTSYPSDRGFVPAISFEHHKLNIPKIHMQREMEVFAKKLLSYEQLKKKLFVVSSYIYLLDNLINKDENVIALLVKKGYISYLWGWQINC